MHISRSYFVENENETKIVATMLCGVAVEINLIFRRVRARTNHAQKPYTHGSLPGEELYFKRAGR